MPLSFFETMRGHLVDDEGDVHLIDFEIKAEASHITRWLFNGLARITGIVRARDWGHDQPLQGTLRLSPLKDRRIEYDFRYADDDGHRYHFFGHKDLNLLRPLESMTTLHATLERDGKAIAKGTMFFDLNDLPSFLSGWSLSSSIRALDLKQRQSDTIGSTDILDDDERRALRALAEAIIVPGNVVPAVDGSTMVNLERYLGTMPSFMRTVYLGTLRALDAAALARHQQLFASLDLDARRGLVEALNDNRPAGHGLIFALGAPIKMAHFSRRDYLDAIGVPTYDNPVREKKPRWMANVFTPDDLEEETTLPADVVVVGTGAGGAPVAARLAEMGLAVAVVETGRYHHRDAFAGAPETRMTNFYYGGGMDVTVGNMPLILPTGKMVGGSTAINSGTCFATPDDVLNEWRTDLGLPDDFAPDVFGRHLDRVMAYMQVGPGDPKYVGEIGTLVGKGAEAMGASSHGPLPRNAPACDGQGVCVFGCPTDAKLSTNVSYMPRALRAGASVFTGMPVTRILTRGRKAVAIEARGQDRNGAKRVLRIRANAIVISCGTLRSPLLLGDNGVDLPALGKNLSVHPATGMLCMSDQITTPWAAIPQGYGVEGLADERIRFEGYWGPPQISGMTVPLVGNELTRWMDKFQHVGNYGFMVRDKNVGSVRRGFGGRPLIRYDVTRETLELMQQGAAIMAELLLEGGADEVLAGVGPITSVRSVEEARRIATLNIGPSDMRGAAFHPLGTCRMGTSARTSVVDFEHRVHGTDNLYVVDGSTVPTSLGVNPQITIMAMAERAAELMGERLN